MEYTLYVDGSYSNLNPTMTYGAILLVSNDKPIYAQRYRISHKDFVSMRNIGGELISALKGMMFIIRNFNYYCHSETGNVPDSSLHDYTVHIIYDYVGIAEFAKKYNSWKPNKKKNGTKLYATYFKAIREMYPNIDIKFRHVKSHTGVRWNEEVDKIVKGAITGGRGYPVEERDVEVEDDIL